MFSWFKKLSADKRPKTLGQLGEEFAQAEYKKRGYKVLATNFFNSKGLRRGEVDFIAKNDNSIVFVEVKTRTIGDERFGSAALAVNYFKQEKLLRAVKTYLLQNQQYCSLHPQIDVCLIELDPVDPFDKLRVNPEQSRGVDKNFRIAKIIVNAVEDWN